ncbi:hypothetical protein Y1Q_0010884 [Alligator mississippiensis]|uniref:Uncharacterized protein n=1 Tax=Alligator mississippiensis TaxID=8496 RepID=A0A151M777_ALLMI|nr:hypothetical protein Y1Q_0010884 [Alligator mississippiensis]
MDNLLSSLPDPSARRIWALLCYFYEKIHHSSGQKEELCHPRAVQTPWNVKERCKLMVGPKVITWRQMDVLKPSCC